ncbi:MAG TPA: glycosyltransferase [Pyrinomonadaceae bacterium]|nr:glycosyltransferase [Pyrinomonadaceae bacterium]
MNRTPDISVVMSVYNGAKYLRETLNSVLSQRAVSIELIVVNDGSTDESGQLLDQHAEDEPRLRVIHQQNRGLTKALISGCEAARGSYIARQDVGDCSQSNRLFLQRRALNADPSVVFVSSWTEFRGPGGEFLYVAKGNGLAGQPIRIISDGEVHGVIDGPTSHPSVMFRKDAYLRAGGYRAEFYYGQDWDLWYRLAEVGKFQMIESALYMARIMPNSISMEDKVRQEKISRLSRAALHQRLQQLAEQPMLHAASKIRPVSSAVESRRRRAQALYFIGECLRRNGDHRAPHYFKESVRDSPLFVKSWLRLLQAQLSRI